MTNYEAKGLKLHFSREDIYNQVKKNGLAFEYGMVNAVFAGLEKNLLIFLSKSKNTEIAMTEIVTIFSCLKKIIYGNDDWSWEDIFLSIYLLLNKSCKKLICQKQDEENDVFSCIYEQGIIRDDQAILIDDVTKRYESKKLVETAKKAHQTYQAITNEIIGVA